MIKKITESLRAERKRQKRTLEDVSQSSDISLSQISRIELGDTSLTLYSFIRLVHALDISPTEFLNEFINGFNFEIPKLFCETRNMEFEYPTFTVPDIENFINYSIRTLWIGDQLIKKRLRKYIVRKQDTLPESQNIFDEEKIISTVNNLYKRMLIPNTTPIEESKYIHYPINIDKGKIRQIYQAEGALLEQDVGAYIYNLRSAQNLSMKELGDEVGLAPATIMAMEKNLHDRVLLSSILKLNQVLNTNGELIAIAWRAGRLYLGIDRIPVGKSNSYFPIHQNTFERLIILLRIYQHFDQLDEVRDYIEDVRKDAR